LIQGIVSVGGFYFAKKPCIEATPAVLRSGLFYFTKMVILFT